MSLRLRVANIRQWSESPKGTTPLQLIRLGFVVTIKSINVFVPNSTNSVKNLKRNVSQTRKQHSLKALTIISNISKLNHNDTYHENNR